METHRAVDAVYLPEALGAKKIAPRKQRWNYSFTFDGIAIATTLDSLSRFDSLGFS